ncbi:hypothetical protein [Dickeya dadantii]|nr:hypothetical protein [Dickeya dadantii]
MEKCDSIESLRQLAPQKIGQLIYVVSYSPGISVGGGIFVSQKNEASLPDDSGVLIHTENNMMWSRVDASSYKKNIKKPEWYGCIGDGKTDDSESFQRMLRSLKDGDVIELKKKASYFNALPNRQSRWIIRKNNITIIGNGAIIARRPTSEATKEIDDGNLATLKVTGNNFTVLGELTITGNEKKMPLVDKKLRIIGSSLYSRGYVSSHGLFLENVNGATLSKGLVCCDAVFPCYVLGSNNVSIKGKYNNSGQVYPVVGTDLQIGSGVKIAKTKNFIVDISSDNCAYCGCEIEPYSEMGDVSVFSSNAYMYGCIIHRNSCNMKIEIKAVDSLNAALRISAGSSNIKGNVYAYNCKNACLITSENDSVCEGIVIDIHTQNTVESELISMNVNNKSPSTRNSLITITPIKSKLELKMNKMNSDYLKTPSLLDAVSSAPIIRIDNAQDSNITLNTTKTNRKIDIKNSSNLGVNLTNIRLDSVSIMNVNNKNLKIKN